MSEDHRCCFIIKLENATTLIGWIGALTAGCGMATAVSNFAEVFHSPEDPIIYSLLQIVFFLGIQGVVFHLVFLIVSIILILGSVKKIPPLFIPWMAWTPFCLLAIIVNIVMILTYDALLAIPVVCFAVLIFILKIYATIIVAYQFKELIKYETRRAYFEGASIPSDGPGFSAYFDKDTQRVRVIPMLDPAVEPSSSSEAPRNPLLDKPSMRGRLSHTYAKVLDATQPKS